jgi:hypothetical protein
MTGDNWVMENDDDGEQVVKTCPSNEKGYEI